MSDSLGPHGLQHTRLPCPALSPTVCSNPCPLSWWCNSAILPSAAPFPFPFHLSQHQGLFQWVSSLHQVNKVLQLQLQHQFLTSRRAPRKSVSVLFQLRLFIAAEYLFIAAAHELKQNNSLDYSCISIRLSLGWYSKASCGFLKEPLQIQMKLLGAH